MTSIIRSSVALLAFASLLAGPAFADQQYAVHGSDEYRIASDLQTKIAYTGHQTLKIIRRGSGTHFAASVEVLRRDQAGSSHAQASFGATLTSTGEQVDDFDHDPNYLTVLNQPFSIQLDLATLRDLSHLRARIPFDFPSPMTGGTLRGYLTRGESTIVAGHRALGVHFDADGPMRGPLPERPGTALSGTMHMKGVAYYDTSTALLVSLDANLRITGNLDEAHKATPVSILYQRSIRALPSQTTETASRH